MLILVAVTITIAVNGGLFDYAGRAARETNTRIEEEQDWANIEDGKNYEYLIDKYAAKELITFSFKQDHFDVKTYQAEKGMSLEDWAASDYNVDHGSLITVSQTQTVRRVEYSWGEFEFSPRPSKDEEITDGYVYLGEWGYYAAE